MPDILSPSSTLVQLNCASDEELEVGAWNLPPRTVLNYVLFLRRKLRTAEVEVDRLLGVVTEQQKNLNGLMSSLGVGNMSLPADAPPAYDSSLKLAATISAPPEYFSLTETVDPSAPQGHVSFIETVCPPSGHTSSTETYCPPPGHTSLTETQELSDQSRHGATHVPCSSSSEDPSPYAASPPISTVLKLEDNIVLRPGSNVQGTFYYKKGTKIFSLSLQKEPGVYIFHIEFRPSPHGNIVVMDSNCSSNWEEDVRTKLPRLVDEQLVIVNIECRDTMFKVTMNGEELRRVFNYRYPLEDVRELGVTHGSKGNKWISLNYN